MRYWFSARDVQGPPLLPVTDVGLNRSCRFAACDRQGAQRGGQRGLQCMMGGEVALQNMPINLQHPNLNASMHHLWPGGGFSRAGHLISCCSG